MAFGILYWEFYIRPSIAWLVPWCMFIDVVDSSRLLFLYLIRGSHTKILRWRVTIDAIFVWGVGDRPFKTFNPKYFFINIRLLVEFMMPYPLSHGEDNRLTSIISWRFLQVKLFLETTFCIVFYIQNINCNSYEW